TFGERLGELGDGAAAGNVPQGGVRGDLRHQVVVVGVEPFGHLQRRGIRIPAGEAEVVGQAERLTGVRDAEAGRYGADLDGGAEHVVVVGEIARDGRVLPVQAELAQALPGGAAHFGGDGGQVGLAGAAGPVRFEGSFEFTACPDAGVAGDRGG